MNTRACDLCRHYKKATFCGNKCVAGSHWMPATSAQLIERVMGPSKNLEGNITSGYRYKGSAYEIKNVIFNPPATIVQWSDGTKTVVKCQEGDVFDPEKGLAMAITKKAFGNKGSYCNEIKKWTEKYEEPSTLASNASKAAEAMDSLTSALATKEVTFTATVDPETMKTLIGDFPGPNRKATIQFTGEFGEETAHWSELLYHPRINQSIIECSKCGHMIAHHGHLELGEGPERCPACGVMMVETKEE